MISDTELWINSAILSDRVASNLRSIANKVMALALITLVLLLPLLLVLALSPDVEAVLSVTSLSISSTSGRFRD